MANTISADDLRKLSAQDQQEIIAFSQKQTEDRIFKTSEWQQLWIKLGNGLTENKIGAIQFTNMCFKKCVKGPLTSPALTSEESSCMVCDIYFVQYREENCFNRYIDTTIKITQTFQEAQRH
ncbi:uncharacterized protein V1516DRAFT_664252 [Lipomyces oligophaga]|uniref:uncharacterized protein n=1 Tax=Lipomyces oligophaga TaxID=45792 RepID=UPI0034CEAB5E